MERKFSDKEISDFCTVTKDNNDIHNPQFMGKKSKLAIVPGMMILSQVLDLPLAYDQNFNLMEIYFSSPLSSGETVEFSYDAINQTEGIILNARRNGNNLLAKLDPTTKKEIGDSKLLTTNPEHLQNIGYPLRFDLSDGKEKDSTEAAPNIVNFERENIEDFGKIVSSNSDITDTLFAIAMSSRALIDSFAYPVSRNENKAKEEIAKIKGKVLPVYQSLRIFLPEGIQDLRGGKLEFYNDVNVKKRDITFDLKCQNDGRTLYFAQYSLKAMTERVLIRYAKDDPKKDPIKILC